MTLSGIPATPRPRLLILENTTNPDGDPLYAVMPPGPRAVAVAFKTVKEALAALVVAQVTQ